MRAEKPCRTPPPELKTEPYGASYGPKPYLHEIPCVACFRVAPKCESNGSEMGGWVPGVGPILATPNYFLTPKRLLYLLLIDECIHG